MPKCGIIKKSDGKPCTNEGQKIYDWKCRIHKKSKTPDISGKHLLLQKRLLYLVNFQSVE